MRRFLPLVLLLSMPAAAQARLVVVTSGPAIVHAGEPASQPSIQSVGYHYESFGLFWIDLWTWDGRYCLYGGRMDTVFLSDQEAARILGKPVGELRQPFGYRYPPGLLVLGGLFVLALLVLLVRCGVRAATSSRLVAAAVQQRA